MQPLIARLSGSHRLRSQLGAEASTSPGLWRRTRSRCRLIRQLRIKGLIRVRRFVKRLSSAPCPPDSGAMSAAGLGCIGGIWTAPPASTAKFWLDEILWSQGRVAVELMEQVFIEAGGVRAGGPARIKGPGTTNERGHYMVDERLLGYNNINRWDVLWTKSVYAIRAAPHLQPGQLVSAVVGLNSLTMKKRLLMSLKRAYQQEAFSITPLSFALPEELPQWQAWLQQNPEQDTGYWILKTGQDAGKGLQLAPTSEAVQLASAAPRSRKVKAQLKVAQRYLTDPLLLDGRKFHLRLWVVVTGHCPLRAYMHTGGLVLFSSDKYDSSAPISGQHAISAGHITNYAWNVSGQVWDLEQLKGRLGAPAFDKLWAQMMHLTARSLSAAVKSLHDADAWLQPAFPDYGFQMVGVDYLVDEAMVPWLLEYNSAPSIMVQHEQEQEKELIYTQKHKMLTDMVAIVRHRYGRQQQEEGQQQQGSSGSSGSEGGGPAGVRRLTWQQHLAVELQNRGGFLPLMPLFPLENQRIPWQAQDLQLRSEWSKLSAAAGLEQ